MTKDAAGRGLQRWTMPRPITILPVILLAIILERFIPRGLLVGTVQG